MPDGCWPCGKGEGDGGHVVVVNSHNPGEGPKLPNPEMLKMFKKDLERAEREARDAHKRGTYRGMDAHLQGRRHSDDDSDLGGPVEGTSLFTEPAPGPRRAREQGPEYELGRPGQRALGISVVSSLGREAGREDGHRP